MFQWNNIQLNDHHRRHLLRQAENERLARQAQAGRSRSNAIYAAFLAGIGRQLAQLGASLQAEYDAAPSLKPEL